MAQANSRYQQLKQIKDKIVSLKQSPLYEYRRKNGYVPVIGQGSHEADIMFIGEAPGENEAETGRPFCGAAGRILDELLNSVGLDRDEVYITNVVKDRPPGNRDPKPKEIKLYTPFLVKQIEIIQPRFIATLGRFAMKFIMREYGLKDELGKISDLHGQVFSLDLKYGQVYLVPLYHPAVALYQHSMKQTLVEDFQVLTTIDSLV
jgi:DNA polymerase